MQRLITLFLPAFLFLSAPAFAGYGGGGVTISGGYLPQTGGLNFEGDRDPMGAYGCFGGGGYGVSRVGMRVGGETRGCGGNNELGSWGIGLQLGFQRAWRSIYAAGYSGVGIGWRGDEDDFGRRWDSMNFYLRPTGAVGLMLGAVAIETGIYLELPINMVQWVEDGRARGYIQPHAGLQVSVLFGGFRSNGGLKR